MRRWLLALVLAGCFSKPGEPLASDARAADANDARDIDAFVTTDCSTVPFTGVPQILVGTMGEVDADPALTGNLLDLFFVKDTGGFVYDIWHASRPDLASQFALDSGPLPFGVDASTSETDPAPSSDGQIVAFRRTSPMQPGYGYLATRTAGFSGTTPGTWNVVPMPGLESMEMSSLDLSPDGKTLYWNDSTNTLHIADFVAGTFHDRAMLYGTGMAFPAVSSDGKEIYFDGVNGTWWSVRSSTTAEFPSGGSTISAYADPDLSPDGQVLVMAVNGAAGTLTRTCPAQ